MLPNRNIDTPLKPWSWSALDSYETCPLRHYKTKVTKEVREKTSPEMSYGLNVHRLLEQRVKTKQPLPKDLAKLEPIVSKLLSAKGEVLAEQDLAMTSEFKQTSWFGSDVWVRAKLDVVVHMGPQMLLVDWKTGKMKEDFGQLSMAAQLKFMLHPELERIGMVFVWTKYNDTSKQILTREEAALNWATNILPRVARYQRAFDVGEFPAKPSGLCKKHCPVTSCVHHGLKG